MAKHRSKSDRKTKLLRVVLIVAVFALLAIIVILTSPGGGQKGKGKPHSAVGPSTRVEQPSSAATPTSSASQPTQPTGSHTLDFSKASSSPIKIKKNSSLAIFAPISKVFVKYRLDIKGAVTYPIPQNEIEDTCVGSDDQFRINALNSRIEVSSIESTNGEGYSLIKIKSPSFLKGKELNSVYLKLYAITQGSFVDLIPSKTPWFERMNYEQATAKIVRGNKVATVDTSQSVGWKSWDITKLMNQWIANPSTNFGFILSPSGEQSTFFHSSESTKIALRPTLEVRFSSSQMGDVKESQRQKPLTTVNTSGLPSGTYNIELVTGGSAGEEKHSKTIVIQ